MVSLHADLDMYKTDSCESCVAIQIFSVGVFDADRNVTYTPPILDFVSSSLDIPENRIELVYFPVEFYNVGLRH